MDETLHKHGGKVKFAVLRVPFFLEPDYPEDKEYVETNRERLIKKWGGKEGWEEQKTRHDLKGRGEEAGIPHFNLDRLTANTMASHRLIQHISKRYGLHVSERLYDALNVYYFVDGHSLNDHERLAHLTRNVLVECDVEDPIASVDEILAFLKSDEGRSEIERALKRLRNELGIHSIPKFIIEGRTLVDGAAHSQVFVRVFDDIISRGVVHNEGKPLFGDILGVSRELVQQGSHFA